MTDVVLPKEISEPLRDLLPALAAVGFFPASAEFSEQYFGNIVVAFKGPDLGSFQLVRDRGQFQIEGIAKDKLESAGLWRSFHGIRELLPLLVRFLTLQTKP